MGAAPRRLRSGRRVGEQVLLLDAVPVAEHDRALDDVLELAHVARPAVLEQGRERVVREGLDRLAVLGRVPPQKEARERGHVAAAIAQRRQLDRDDIETIEEVLAEAPCLISAPRSRFVAAMMRTSTLSVSLPPTRSNVFSCRNRRSLTCTAAGSRRISSRKRVPPSACLKRPSRRATAPVKAPRSWPKSSLSRSDSREGGAVQADERRLGARAEASVDGLGDELLAGPALAGDEDARLARADLGDELEDGLHLRVGRARCD